MTSVRTTGVANTLRTTTSPASTNGVDYDQLPRAALIKLLRGHDAALLDAGADGIVMNYSGRAAPWQIIRQVNRLLKY